MNVGGSEKILGLISRTIGEKGSRRKLAQMLWPKAHTLPQNLGDARAPRERFHECVCPEIFCQEFSTD